MQVDLYKLLTVNSYAHQEAATLPLMSMSLKVGLITGAAVSCW